MSSEFIAGILSFIGGISIAYFSFKLQQKRKIIEYNVSSISLLRINLAVENILTVSVNKYILTGNEADKNETEQLKSVYGFQIYIQNIGNDDIEKLDDIEIRLDDSAKIVKYETEPVSTDGYKILIERVLSQPNICRLKLPYLNKGSKLIVKLISTENSNSECKVIAHGIGIRTRRARTGTQTVALGLASLIGSMAVGLIIAAIDDAITNPPGYLWLFGDIPHAIVSTIFAAGLLTYIYMAFAFAKKMSAQQLSQNWDWQMPRANKKRGF